MKIEMLVGECSRVRQIVCAGSSAVDARQDLRRQISTFARHWLRFCDSPA